MDVSEKSFVILEREFIRAYHKRMYKPQLFNGVPTILTELLSRGFHLSILSASHKEVLSPLISYYKLNEYFDSVVGVNNYSANGKIRGGRDLLKKINIHKEKIIMIGDTNYDYRVAQKLGLDCLLVSWGHQSRNQLNKSTNHIINTLNDFMVLL